MNWADWAIIGIFSLSCFIGLIRGFVREALSLVIWLAAIVIARVFGGQLEILLTGFIETPSVRLIAAYALLFFATLFIGAMLSYLVGALIRATGLSGTDRLLGLVFGAARAFVIVMAILIVLPSFVPVNEDNWWKQAQLIPHFQACEGWVMSIYGEVSRWVQTLFMSVEPVQPV